MTYKPVFGTASFDAFLGIPIEAPSVWIHQPVLANNGKRRIALLMHAFPKALKISAHDRKCV
ncbi:hypothetical protein U1R88_03235 [Labrys sp. ZIDIC5]|nr:hypothetical protein [Labrys sp. ZIDIC5]MDZ5448630.1 hypothetical protein [Labrys sp. ZIDIC5]